MSLKDNIRLLTQPHIGYNHAGKIVKQDSLLTQLNKAERIGGTSTTSEKPIPANINAVALAQDILKEAQQHQYEMTGTMRGSLWAIILSWQQVEDKEWVAFLEHVTQDWIDAIRNLTNPTRPRRPLHQPCASCGNKYTPGEDGKRIPALTAWVWDRAGERIAPSENWEVTCSNCGTQWTGREVTKSYWRALR